jgi:hypothetical protein
MITSLECMPRTPRVAPGRDVAGVNALLGAWWLKAKATARGRLVEEWRIRVGKRRKAEENSLADGTRRAPGGLYQGDPGGSNCNSVERIRKPTAGGWHDWESQFRLVKFVSPSPSSHPLSLDFCVLILAAPSSHVPAKIQRSQFCRLGHGCWSPCKRELLRRAPKRSL